MVFVLLLLIAATAITEATTSITYAQQQQAATTTTTTNNATGVNATCAAASNATSPTNATTGAANNVTTNSSTIATTQSETLWEAEVRERREQAGLPLENNSTLPNLIKSPESLEIDKLQAQDPKFANFETILDQCYNNADSEPSHGSRLYEGLHNT
jgi:hypothetical protein